MTHFWPCNSFCSSCWGYRIQNSWDSVVSSRIGMKFGTIVLQVNTHRLMQSDFWMWRHTFKMAAMTSFYTEMCCHLVSAYAAYAQRPLLHMEI